ncbi:MAG TPA: ferritin-like domain-containing protein [Acidimicrobiales bacterium]
MATLTPTAATGARSTPAEMTYVDPARQMSDGEREGFLDGSGLNGPFVADLLSDMLAHERAGAMLYRSVAQRTHNPVLEERYRHFGDETIEHVDILERLIGELGGDAGYVSPAARATEKSGLGLVESTFLLSGSVDLMTQELVMLDAVLLAEAKDQANWAALSTLAGELPEGDIRAAFQRAIDDVVPREAEHLDWARDMRAKLIGMQARSGTMAKMGARAEEMTARIHGLLE